MLLHIKVKIILMRLYYLNQVSLVRLVKSFSKVSKVVLYFDGFGLLGAIFWRVLVPSFQKWVVVVVGWFWLFIIRLNV